MRELRYTILLTEDKEQGGHWVTVPALPGCFTQGDTLEEAIAMAKEAIATHVEGLVADGDVVPQEDTPPQAVTITVPVAA